MDEFNRHMPRKIKIIHTLVDTGFCGEWMLLLCCLRNADRRIFDISVALPKKAAACKMVRAQGFRVIETEHGGDKYLDLAATCEYIGIFKREAPDIVHTYSSLSAGLAARLSGVKKVFRTHHFASPGMGIGSKFPVRNMLTSLENRITDRFVATAQAARAVLSGRGIKDDKISVIISGSEPLRAVSEREQAELRRRLSISDGDFVVGTVARLESVKNHKCFLEGAAEAARARDNMRFIIVGSGSLGASLKVYARELGLADKVIFTGFAADIAPYMSIMDVNVNTSDSEASNLALCEGFSLGVPAVVSDCSSNTAMVEDGVCGLVFERGNSEGLATALEMLDENRALLEALGKNALECYKEKFSAATMMRRLEALYINELEK